MNVGRQEVAQSLVNQAVAGNGSEAVKAISGNPDVEVPPSVTGACVPGMQVAFVGDLENPGLQRLAKAVSDYRDPVNAASARQGITWIKGFTWTSTQTPACT